MKIQIVGLGYIGIPTAVFFAKAGFQVRGSDINTQRVSQLNEGNLPFNEPGLTELFLHQYNSGSLSFGTEVEPADVFIICVPTPVVEGIGSYEADLGSLWSAVRQVAGAVKNGDLVVIESTVPVGTTALVRDFLVGNCVGVEEIKVAYAPERVIPGAIIREMTSNSRIVGGVDQVSTDAALSVYSGLTRGSVEGVSAEVAEFTKLVENSFRDVNLAFANELSMLASDLRVPVREVIRLANLHPRVNVLDPGPGVGGHCIPVDPWFLIAARPELTPLMRVAREVNKSKELWVYERISQELRDFTLRVGRPASVALIGLSYKANVGDLRESPALNIASRISRDGLAQVYLCDPHLKTQDAELTLTEFSDAVMMSDVLVVLVGHDEFGDLGTLSSGGDKILLNYSGVGL